MALPSSTTTRKRKRLSENERKKIIDIKKSAWGAQSCELCFIENVSETVTLSGEKYKHNYMWHIAESADAGLQVQGLLSQISIFILILMISCKVYCRPTVTLESIGGIGLNFWNLTPPDPKSWIRHWSACYLLHATYHLHGWFLVIKLEKNQNFQKFSIWISKFSEIFCLGIFILKSDKC